MKNRVRSYKKYNDEINFTRRRMVYDKTGHWNVTNNNGIKQSREDIKLFEEYKKSLIIGVVTR